MTFAFSFKFHASARDDGRADSVYCLSATIIRLDTFLIAKTVLKWIFSFFTATISITFSSALKILKSQCPGSTLSPTADKLFLGGEEIQFLFSLHCQPPEHEVSSPPLCCHSWRGLSCPLQPPHTPCALLMLQPQPGWCCHMAVRALLNAQLQLLLVQGAIARDKTGKMKAFCWKFEHSTVKQSHA